MAKAARLGEDGRAAILLLNAPGQAEPARLCSSLLVEPQRSATGEMLFGRNMDLASLGCLDRLSLVAVYRPEGRRAFASVTWPAYLGISSGINDAGLALATNYSGPLKDNAPRFSPEGMPHRFLYRQILEECATVEEAEALLTSNKLTDSVLLAACDTRRAVVFEITPGKMVTRNAEDHLLACTNHFRTPELAVPREMRACDRYETFQKYWQENEPLAWTDVAKAMREVGWSLTLQTMIFEPETLRLRLAIGANPPATARPLTTLNLKELFRHGVSPVVSGVDGTEVSAVEAAAMQRNARPPSEYFSQLDEDQDERLTLEELLVDYPAPEAVKQGTELFGVLDGDRDDQLSLDEFKAGPRRAVFLRRDWNADGALSEREFVQGEMKAAPPSRARRVFELVDKDHDGLIDYGEFLSRSAEAWFVKLDTSEDGRLSYDEYAAGNRPLVRTNRCQAAFSAFDRDKDGSLSLGELSNRPREVLFIRRDANADGRLTFEEFLFLRRAPEQIAAAKEEFARRDRDGDGVLTLEEYVAPAAEADSANADENVDKSSERAAPDAEKTEKEGVVEPAFDPGKPPPRRITGVVVGPDGSPVAGAEVYLFAQAMWHPVFSKPLYSSLPLEPRAEDWYRHHPLDTLGRARTDAAGRFAMQPDPLRPESFFQPHLMVVAKGLGFACPVWDQAAGDVEIRLPREVPIRGRLVTPDGKPAEGVLVRVAKLMDPPKYSYSLHGCQCSFDGYHFADRYRAEFWPRPPRTDAEGSFTLEGIPAGALVFLHLLHPDFAPEWIDVDTRLRPGERARASAPDTFPPTFSLQLKIPRPVEGVVTAADTGQPLAGVLVEVRPGSRHSMGGSYYGRTDEKGRYRFHCRRGSRGCGFSLYPPPESGYLAADTYHRGWPEGEESPVKDFRLDRGKLIRGRVLDEETGKPIPAAGVVYRPSKASPHRYGHHVCEVFRHPALTGDDGRFTLTGLSGPGFLLVETPNRSYVRLSEKGVLPIPGHYPERAMPVGLTPIDVPLAGTLEEEVVIRLRRGRRVTLRAVGPRGEKLPWVRATWEGIDASYDVISDLGRNFPDGRVVLPGLDPSRTTRVFLIYNPRKLGAVFDVTPETIGEALEVRLQPTATVVGQAVTQAGKPAEDAGVRVMISFDPRVS
ncbi:MAG: C45 family autoproteolytic acyltransferase/hydrolase, partial [Planctomycetota bacterium]